MNWIFFIWYLMNKKNVCMSWCFLFQRKFWKSVSLVFCHRLYLLAADFRVHIYYICIYLYIFVYISSRNLRTLLAKWRTSLPSGVTATLQYSCSVPPNYMQSSLLLLLRSFESSTFFLEFIKKFRKCSESRKNMFKEKKILLFTFLEIIKNLMVNIFFKWCLRIKKCPHNEMLETITHL